MQLEVKVPLLPESVSDATVASWYKKVGDVVKEGDVLCELETDKVMLEVPAVESGKLIEVLAEVGAKVAAGEQLAKIDTALESISTAVVDTNIDKPVLDDEDVPASEVSVLDPPASPSVRKSLHENDLSLSEVKGSGKHGRVLEEDVQEKMDSTMKSVTMDLEPHVATLNDTIKVPMTRMRMRIAERLLQSQQQSASLTTFNEVDMSNIMALRSKYKDAFMKKYGVKLGFMSFFVQACTYALEAFPEVNAAIDGSDIVYNKHAHVGIAVSTDKGLVVPVLKQANAMNMNDIEMAIVDFANKAKQAKLTLDEMSGGTFTITNGGTFGSMLSTPILNMPQSAILGMHNIVERPVVVQGEITIRPMMYLALTYDHRIIDGSQSVRFLVTVKQLLEEPSRALLGI